MKKIDKVHCLQFCKDNQEGIERDDPYQKRLGSADKRENIICELEWMARTGCDSHNNFWEIWQETLQWTWGTIQARKGKGVDGAGR